MLPLPSTSSQSSAESSFKDQLRGFRDSTTSAPGMFASFDSFQKSVSNAGQGVVSSVYSAVPSKLTEAISDPVAAQTCGLTRYQRMVGFGVLMSAALVCIVLAFMTMSVIVIRPAKFAVSYTVGSLLLLGSFALLSGPINYAKSLVASERIYFTAVYFGSLAITLYAALIGHSYILTILSSVIQMVSMLWYVLSFFPGGITVLNFIASLFGRAARSALPI